MKIEVFLTPAEFEENSLKEKIAVVIDVLRASTSIITALQNGAKEVIPVAEVETAMKIASNLFAGQSMLCGERNGKLIDGFDLDNSPESYVPEIVTGKSLVFCTTNGSRALVKARHAKSLLVAGFVNVSMVKEFIFRPENEESSVAIVCAGKDGHLSLEDTLCAGLVIDRLMNDKKPKAAFQLTDTALAAQVLYERFRGNELAALTESEHGRYLASIGNAGDIPACAKIDGIQALPVLEDSVIRLHKVETRKFKRVD